MAEDSTAETPVAAQDTEQNVTQADPAPLPVQSAPDEKSQPVQETASGSSEQAEPPEPLTEEIPAGNSDLVEAEKDDLQEDEELTDEELEELRANEVAFSWKASEYVHHHKGIGWYVALVGVLVALSALAAWLHFWLEIAAFWVMGGAILVYARKPPRTLTYELTPTGIIIEGKTFPFKEIRSFSVLPDTEWHMIDLEPTKRFSPRLGVLFGDEDFDSIVGHLELHLPRVERRPDVIEWLSRYLRF